MPAATSLLDFTLNLLKDPQAQADFRASPEHVQAAHGLTGVCCRYPRHVAAGDGPAGPDDWHAHDAPSGFGDACYGRDSYCGQDTGHSLHDPPEPHIHQDLHRVDDRGWDQLSGRDGGHPGPSEQHDEVARRLTH
jgi:hypothetical protein